MMSTGIHRFFEKLGIFKNHLFNSSDNIAEVSDDQVDEVLQNAMLESKESIRSIIGDNYTLLEEYVDFKSSEQLTTVLPKVVGDDGDVFNSSIFEGNFLAVFDEQYLRNSLGWTITLIVAYTLILIIGIVGNSMVILVVIKRAQMRTVMNLFIMNLAVADLFVIVFCVPATLLSNVFTPWILGSVMCKGVAYVQGVSVCASAYSLAAISLDRCKAIYRPFERPSGLSKRQALITICLIWVIAMILTIPWAVIFDVVLSKKDGLCYCLETWKNKSHGKIYFLVANLFFCYSLPLILISISNVKIWCHVTHRKVPQDSASAHIIKKMHRRTRQGVRKMLGIVTLAFCLSWLPLYILVTWAKFASNISDWDSNLINILMPLAQWLGSWNSSINPILYAFLNIKFREMFKSILPSWLPCAQKNNLGILTRNIVKKGSITNGTKSMVTKKQASCIAKSTGSSNTIQSYSNTPCLSDSRYGHHNHPDTRRRSRKDEAKTVNADTSKTFISTVAVCIVDNTGSSTVSVITYPKATSSTSTSIVTDV